MIYSYSFVNTLKEELKQVGPLEAEINLLVRNVRILSNTAAYILHIPFKSLENTIYIKLYRKQMLRQRILRCIGDFSINWIFLSRFIVQDRPY